MAECAHAFVAPVAKLVDAPDLGSGAERRTGSSPARRTIYAPSLSKQLEGGFLFMMKNWTLSSRFRPYLTRYFRHAYYIMHGYLAAM